MILELDGLCTLSPCSLTNKLESVQGRATSNSVRTYLRSASLVALLAYAIGHLSPSTVFCSSTTANPLSQASVHSLVRSGGCNTGAETSLRLSSQNATSHSVVQSNFTSFLVSAVRGLEITAISGI